MNKNSHHNNPETRSDEPTVLDLYKSIFKDWDSFFNFIASAFDAARREQINRTLSREQELIAEPEISISASQPFSRFPIRAMLGLVIALSAQYLLEPPGFVVALGSFQIEKIGRNAPLGVGLYAISLGLVVWSYLVDGWRLPALFPDHNRRDPETIRVLPLGLAVISGFAAFVMMGDNLFTSANVIVWLLAIGFLIFALWLPYRRARIVRSADERRRNLLWTALLVAAAAFVIFFRAYQVGIIPPEPFSDHAEKILDVYEVSQGETRIFFPRNTGREAIQMYWTLLVSWVFGTGLSFQSLKIGTVLLGLLTLPFIYLLGNEIGGKRVGLFALIFAGIGYWPNVISRVGLRFPLYPLFVAPTLFYLIRGLRTRNRNDFILSGLFLGLGLHGYSPIRILPFIVIAAILLYVLHAQSKGVRRDALLWLVIVGLIALAVFIPLLRYSVDNPDAFAYRAFSRLGSLEQELPAPALQIFFSNLWKGLGMFNWDNGEIWVHSVTRRPALDVVSAALFLIGMVLLLIRYIRTRHWLDLFLLLSIPLLTMPSILSLAFPGENPALNRAGGAYVTAFVIAALALDGLVSATLNAGLAGIGRGKVRTGFAWVLAVGLMAWSGVQNYDLVFNQYADSFTLGAWNSSEMGAVIQEFDETYGRTDTVWIVPFPHWVDTRLPGVWAGIPNRDFAAWREQLPETVQLTGPKLFLVKANLEFPESNDEATLDVLRELYPGGTLDMYDSDVIGHDFWMYSVP